jgi:hypothetical protein
MALMNTVAMDFATTMGCEPPRPIERTPQAWCEVAQCHANVQQLVHVHGGRGVWGWHFNLNTTDPNQCRVEAVFHAVWESPQGDLIDITPKSERVVAGWKTGIYAQLPFFCEDKRYFQKCKVEDLGGGLLHFQTVEEVFPQQQACVLMLPSLVRACGGGESLPSRAGVYKEATESLELLGIHSNPAAPDDPTVVAMDCAC